MGRVNIPHLVSGRLVENDLREMVLELLKHSRKYRNEAKYILEVLDGGAYRSRCVLGRALFIDVNTDTTGVTLYAVIPLTTPTVVVEYIEGECGDNVPKWRCMENVKLHVFTGGKWVVVSVDELGVKVGSK